MANHRSRPCGPRPRGGLPMTQPSVRYYKLGLPLRHKPRSPGSIRTTNAWLSPRPVTHQHVTRARPTSPGTPRPFYCTRPSATLSALHRPIGSGHRPAARSRTLGPPAHARRTLLFLRLGPAPLPDSEAATWAWARNLPHTAPPLSSAHHPSPTGDRGQATPARTQRLMLNAPALGAALHAMLCCAVPALYPRQHPNSGRATKAPDRHHNLGEDLELDAWPTTVKPLDAPPINPPARPVLDSSRAARRDEQRRWGGSTPTTPLLSVRGCHKGFDPPGQHNLPDISGMRKRAQVRLAAPAERRGGFGTCGPGAGHYLLSVPTPNPDDSQGPDRRTLRPASSPSAVSDPSSHTRLDARLTPP